MRRPRRDPVPFEMWRTYYGSVRSRMCRNLRAHVAGQVIVSFIAAVLSGLLAWWFSAGVASLFFAVGAFGILMILTMVFYELRAPVELHDELTGVLDDTRGQLDAVLKDRKRDREIRLEPVKRAPGRIGGVVINDQEQEVMQVHVPIYNRSRGEEFTAFVVDQSVKGLDIDYPQGSFVLGWQTPNVTDRQPIPQNMDARIDVAWVFPKLEQARFLGPGGLLWAQHTVTDPDGIVTGEIVIAAVGRNAQQRFRFNLSIGTVHPVGIDLVPL